MNNRLACVLGALIVLAAAALIADTNQTRAQLKSSDPSAQEAQARIIGTKVDVDAPLKITALKTNRGGIKRDEKFFADDDWLRGLTIRLTNDSGKAVSFVGLVLLFTRTEDQKPGIPAGWPFEYGLDPFESVEDPMPMSQFEGVLPGNDLEIQLSDREYEEIKSFLRGIQFPSSIRQLEVRIIKIGFSDGTAWNNGYLFRRDPMNSNGPLKGWVPIEDPPRSKPQAGQSKSSARSRTAFLLRSGLNSSDRASYSETSAMN